MRIKCANGMNAVLVECKGHCTGVYQWPNRAAATQHHVTAEPDPLRSASITLARTLHYTVLCSGVVVDKVQSEGPFARRGGAAFYYPH